MLGEVSEWSQYRVAAGLQGARSFMSIASAAVIDTPRHSTATKLFTIVRST
jgi:hypothetical protein